MIYDFKFKLHCMVKIIALGTEGVIVSIYIVDKAIQYQVRYFWQGEAKEVYFYEWELEFITFKFPLEVK